MSEILWQSLNFGLSSAGGCRLPGDNVIGQRADGPAYWAVRASSSHHERS